MIHRAYRFPAASHRSALEAAAPLALDWIGASEATPNQHWALAVWQGAPPSAFSAHERPPGEAPRWWAGVPLPTAPEPIRREDMPQLTPVQFRGALRVAGLTSNQVETAIGTIVDPLVRETAMERWRFADRFVRTDPLLGQLAAMLGLSAEQVDALWMQAAGN